MATEKQEALAEAIVANKRKPRDKRKNKAELLVYSGYSPKSASQSAKLIMEQKGVKEALAKYGLTEGLITKALVADIKAKPSKRVEELKLGADILGLRNDGKETPPPTVTNIAIINLIPIKNG